jgi:hypothetical protein
MLTVIIGGFCVVYFVITQILEWTHHIGVIEERWPKAYKILMSTALRVLLLLVAIGLFAEVLRERSQETAAKHETAPQGAKQQSGPATTFGPCSPATTGNENKINVDCGKTPDKATKSPSK